MKIRPLQDRVIVKRVQEEEKTKGGIIIPDTAKKSPSKARCWPSGTERCWRTERCAPWT